MSHYYSKDGKPMHFVERAKGVGTRPTTVADARKLGLLPGPTTVLGVLHKEGLVQWLIRTACEAVLTAPRLAGEDLDAFVTRVLDTEKQQDQESQIAKDRGSAIHDAISCFYGGRSVTDALLPFVRPIALEMERTVGKCTKSEFIVVGDGYAGLCDALFEQPDLITVVDFKTSKNLPKSDAYPEHRMQVAAYASGLGNTGDNRIECAVMYIDSQTPGNILLAPVPDWQEDYRKFKLLLQYWQLANNI